MDNKRYKNQSVAHVKAAPPVRAVHRRSDKEKREGSDPKCKDRRARRAAHLANLAELDVSCSALDAYRLSGGFLASVP